MARACLFCGGGPLTGEHIWPDWMRRALARLTADPFTVTKEDTVGRKRVWTTTAFPTVRRFCKTCNTGWMSEIEAATKPILEPMMLAPRRGTFVLSPWEQITLARWAFKTALVLASTEQKRKIPDGWYRDFHRWRTLPEPGAVIWTTAYLGPGKAAHGHLRALRFEATRRIFSDSNLVEHVATDGFTVTISAYRVIFQVLGFFDGPWRPTRDGDAESEQLLIRLWPGTARPVAWPKDGKAINDDGLMSISNREDFFDPLAGLYDLARRVNGGAL